MPYPSTHFGRYEIVRKLGRSMTDVYLAVDTLEHRPAALKLIKAAHDPNTQLILEAERRGVAIQKKLHDLDARVAEVYDYGDLDGYFFVAMQYVEGRSLAEVLERERRIEPRRAARIALEICAQLARFHSLQADLDGPKAGVIHGDIKPSNLQLGPHDTVRLLDFGIAKALRAGRVSTVHSLGTPSYCSPERLDESAVDAQSDLWSVGVTLYETLAGAPPYRAEDTRRLERLIRSRRPPGKLPENCPAALKAIVSKAVAGDAQRRYRTAAAFQADLQAFLENRETVAEREQRFGWTGNPTVDSAQPPRARHGWIAGLAAFLTGLLVFIATVYAAQFYNASRRIRGRLDYTQRSMPEIDADWVLYRGLQARFAVLGRLSPAGRLRAPMRDAYLDAANQVIERYHAATNAALEGFDWPKARVSLERALELGAAGDTHGKLALASGYAALLDIMNGKALDRSRVEQLRETARREFAEAARRWPRAPDPHLGLARVYVYSMTQPERATEEFRAAARLGYALGRREFEQQADAYRLRAQQESAAGQMDAARRDAAIARRLYQGIPGSFSAEIHLRQIERQFPPTPKRPATRRSRRWH